MGYRACGARHGGNYLEISRPNNTSAALLTGALCDISEGTSSRKLLQGAAAASAASGGAGGASAAAASAASAASGAASAASAAAAAAGRVPAAELVLSFVACR